MQMRKFEDQIVNGKLKCKGLGRKWKLSVITGNKATSSLLYSTKPAEGKRMNSMRKHYTRATLFTRGLIMVMDCAYTLLFECSDHSSCFTRWFYIHPFIHTFMHWWWGLPCKGTIPPIRSLSRLSILAKDKLSYEEGKPEIKLLIFRLTDNLLCLMSHSCPNSKVIVKLQNTVC